MGLGVPVVSIGGVGTFDGIFLVGILAISLASQMDSGDPSQSQIKEPEKAQPTG
jgi:hypothetical protein